MWEQIRSNRRRSVFVITALGVLLAVLGVGLGGALTGAGEGAVVGGAIALLIWLVMWAVTISQGDSILLRIAGAKEVQKKDHPQLVNVVEEMAIAASLPERPSVYIIDDPAPNAFATGRTPDKAAVTVTTGLLKILNRDELQGVVAHEVGHIRNRDVALMTTAGIMLGAIVLVADVGARAMFFSGGGRRSRSSGGGGGGQAAMVVVAVVFMILAPILAQLLYFALSRKREYLADASGAMFTRYPDGLASALEKLGGSKVPQADTSKVTAPMYIVRPRTAADAQSMKARGARSVSSAFSTHPPLSERIRILRGMAGGAGLQEYDEAYRQVHKGSSVVGARSLAGAAEVPVREPSAAEAPAPPAQRAREASDAYLSASGYLQRACPACGAKVKIPPALKGKVDRCPRCLAWLEAA